MEEHLELCNQYPIKCPEGCGEEVPREMLKTHISEECISRHRPCRYKALGCKFEGSGQDMLVHEEKYTQFHLRMLWKKLQPLHNGHGPDISTNMQATIELMDQRILKMSSQVASLQTEQQKTGAAEQSRALAVEGAVGKLQRSVKELQECYQDLAVDVQTLQAASYGPVYIWRIPDLARRRRDAILGHTVSIYSAPFYTSRHGYKLCLRVYLHGDGSGRGTHLSLFMTVMRGDYDALLPWPFKQTTTLSLLAQDKSLADISQSFKPDESSTSFHRPQTEMNVASGCPQFCPLSVLDNPGYVQNDVLFIKCDISAKGLPKLSTM